MRGRNSTNDIPKTRNLHPRRLLCASSLLPLANFDYGTVLCREDMVLVALIRLYSLQCVDVNRDCRPLPAYWVCIMHQVRVLGVEITLSACYFDN